MIRIKHKGNFNKTEQFLKRNKHNDHMQTLIKYAEIGKIELAMATPLDTGKTAESWGYQITKTDTGSKIVWTNDNMAGNVPVAILIQYGHATRSGTYIEGKDFINPAMNSVLDKLSKDLWKEVIDK